MWMYLCICLVSPEAVCGEGVAVTNRLALCCFLYATAGEHTARRADCTDRACGRVLNDHVHIFQRKRITKGT